MQIWMSFIALPTARLIINNREHGGKHLRARLAKRQDMTDIIGDAWKETIVSAEREAEDANRQQPVTPTAVQHKEKRPLPPRTMRQVLAKCASGHAGAACRILLREDRPDETTQQPVFDDVLTALKLLHPEGSPVTPLPKTDNIMFVDGDLLAQTCRHLSRGRAPGCSGWTEELLATACANQTAAENLAAMVTDIVNDNLPREIRDMLTTSRLVAIPKKPTGVRPIAIAEAVLKVSSAILMATTAGIFDSIFGNIQHGLREGGQENIVHELRETLRSDLASCVIGVDCSNAFNTVERNAIAAQLGKYAELNVLIAYWNLAYTSPTNLRVFREKASDDLLSTRGVRQGDPVAGALFCLAIHPVLVAIARKYPNIKVRAYMDDVVLFGCPRDCCKAFADLKAGLAELGVKVNPAKCKVYGTFSAKVAERCEIINLVDGIEILSAWISRDKASTSPHLAKKNAHYGDFFKAISQDCVPQTARWQLLSACGPARWTYWSRTHPDEEVMDQHIAFDKQLRETFSDIAGIKGALTDESIAMMHLPRRCGGLGLSRFELVAPLAYKASSSKDPDAPDQEALTEDLNAGIIANLEPPCKRQLDSMARVSANHWLNPRGTVESKIGDSWAFGLALQHRIRHFGPNELRARCDGCEIDLPHKDFDAHVLGCCRRTGHGAVSRHHRVKHAIASTLRDAGMDVQEEVKITANGADIMDLVLFTNAGEIWIDVTVLAVDAKSYRDMPRDSAERIAIHKKQRSYAEEARRQQTQFFALVFDVHAALSAEGAKILKKMAQLADADPIELLRNATLQLQVGNGRILATARDHKRRLTIGNRRCQTKPLSDPRFLCPPPPNSARETLA